MGWVVLEANDQNDATVGLVHRMRGPVVAFVGLVVAGTAGLVAIEDWPITDALWMVVITLSSVGYGEVSPLSSAGRWFMMAFIVGGIGVASTAVSQLAQYVAEGGLRGDLLKRRRRREMAALRDHVVVVGYGRLGRELVAELLHEGASVVVIDVAHPALPPPGDVQLLVGDATDDAVLRQAGVERARALAIATPNDAVSVYITLSARQIDENLPIVTRVETLETAVKARRAGATQVVLPFMLSGSRMSHAVLRPESSAFVDRAMARNHDDLRIEDVVISSCSKIQGSLSSLNLRTRFGVIVVGLQRAGQTSAKLPTGSDKVEADDVLVVVGQPGDVRAFAIAASG